jgi:hypothetical protein
MPGDRAVEPGEFWDPSRDVPNVRTLTISVALVVQVGLQRVHYQR